MEVLAIILGVLFFWTLSFRSMPKPVVKPKETAEEKFAKALVELIESRKEKKL
jgi:hypothetical protein